MKNLAGDKYADEYISDELKRAGIEIVKVDPYLISKGEVPYTITGKLSVNGCDIEFHRAWYYWVTKGRVPLEVALKIYAHPEGKRSVRVSGHCGCPPPEDPWIDWIDESGYELGDITDLERYSKDSIIWDCWKMIGEREAMSDSGKFRCIDPILIKEEGTPFITLYHIDSQAGLLLFAETLKGNLTIIEKEKTHDEE